MSKQPNKTTLFDRSSANLEPLLSRNFDLASLSNVQKERLSIRHHLSSQQRESKTRQQEEKKRSELLTKTTIMKRQRSHSNEKQKEAENELQSGESRDDVIVLNQNHNKLDNHDHFTPIAKTTTGDGNGQLMNTSFVSDLSIANLVSWDEGTDTDDNSSFDSSLDAELDFIARIAVEEEELNRRKQVGKNSAEGTMQERIAEENSIRRRFAAQKATAELRERERLAKDVRITRKMVVIEQASKVFHSRKRLRLDCQNKTATGRNKDKVGIGREKAIITLT